MEEKIKLPNRDGLNIYLERIEGTKYKLSLDNNPYPVTYRWIGTKENPKAIDPSGGPFISEGYNIKDYVVKKLISDNKFGIIFEVEKK